MAFRKRKDEKEAGNRLVWGNQSGESCAPKPKAAKVKLRIYLSRREKDRRKWGFKLR